MSEARVRVGGKPVAEIGPGLVVLLGVGREDVATQADWLAAKVAALRIFDDGAGRMGRSLAEIDGEALCVSQFTLQARVRKGTRPSFSDAAPAEPAERLYRRFCEALRAEGVGVEEGIFGARMEVELVNDGPVTLIVET